MIFINGYRLTSAPGEHSLHVGRSQFPKTEHSTTIHSVHDFASSDLSLLQVKFSDL